MKFLAPSIQFGHLITLLLLTLSSAVSYASSEGGGSTITDGKVNYFSLEPAFVVNILDGHKLRYMQVAIDLMSMDSHAIEAVHTHHAPIRNDLLMLLSNRNISEVTGTQQLEKLRQEALTIIQNTLEKYADIKSNENIKTEDGKTYLSGVQEVLFTNFVIQ